jgi:hypothetical protein
MRRFKETKEAKDATKGPYCVEKTHETVFIMVLYPARVLSFFNLCWHTFFIYRLQ